MSDYSTALFATPSWVDGVARLVDLGSVYDYYNASGTPAEADARALALDWAAVGEDLRDAVDEFVESHPS